MVNLHKRIMDLCSEKGISGYRLCKDTGIQPSFLTDLKMGRQKSLSAVNAEKIANYFGVSVSHLLGKEQKNPATENDSEISKAKKELIEKVMQMSDADLEKLNLLLQIVEAK